MGYKQDIQERAEDFIKEHRDEIKTAIVENREFYDVDELTEAVREEEFYFTLGDAVIVLEESSEVEEDTGLWGGKQPEEALQIKAQFTAQHDLEIAVKELYDELKQLFDDLDDPKLGPDADEDAWKADAMDHIIKDWESTLKIEPLKPGSQEEKDALLRWFYWQEKDIGMRSGGPLGSAYIDSRCGSGYTDDSAEFINVDHEVAALLPHLAHKYCRANNGENEGLIDYYLRVHGKFPVDLDKYNPEKPKRKTTKNKKKSKTVVRR